jgi:hypothetical protein
VPCSHHDGFNREVWNALDAQRRLRLRDNSDLRDFHRQSLVVSHWPFGVHYPALDEGQLRSPQKEPSP